MKHIIILAAAILLFAGCTKDTLTVSETVSNDYGRSAFPTYIRLGNDTSYYRISSFTLNGECYLSVCGYPPQYEAPVMGCEVYQIAGPSNALIEPNTAHPYISNLTYGKYTFVGHAFMIGYRSCDSTYQNVNVYDTVNITILKNRKKTR